MFISIIIVPKAASRPRFGSNGAVYTENKYASYLQELVLQLKPHKSSSSLMYNTLKAVFYMPIPKTKEKKIAENSFCPVKPDIDNLAKPLLDGLVKSGILLDDNCISKMVLEKRYSKIPRITLTLELSSASNNSLLFQ